MVLIQVDLSEIENKKLALYTTYTNCPDKKEGLKKLLRELDMQEVRNEFFEGEQDE